MRAAAAVMVAVLGALVIGCGGSTDSPPTASLPTTPAPPPDPAALDRDLATIVTGAQTCTSSPPGPECATAQGLVSSVMDRVGDVADAVKAHDPAKSQRLNAQVRSLSTPRRAMQSCYKPPPLTSPDEQECRLATRVLTGVAVKIRKELAA